MKIVQKKLTDLQKIDKNIRRHSPKQLQEYVRSVRMFGQIRPLVVDEKGVILCGNGLYDALVAVGQEKADCYIVTDLTEAQKKKLMLADNRVYELGMTDTITSLRVPVFFFSKPLMKRTRARILTAMLMKV